MNLKDDLICPHRYVNVESLVRSRFRGRLEFLASSAGNELTQLTTLPGVTMVP